MKVFLCKLFDCVYQARDAYIVALTTIGLFSYPIDRREIMLYALLMIVFMIVLQHGHKKTESILKDSVRKKFVHLDKAGNPYINTEDLEEIVEYLFLLERSEKNV